MLNLRKLVKCHECGELFEHKMAGRSHVLIVFVCKECTAARYSHEQAHSGEARMNPSKSPQAGFAPRYGA